MGLKPSKSRRHQKPVGVRERRLSTLIDEDTILKDSLTGASCVLSKAGIEFARLKTNQDSYFVSEDKMVFAVFDGHGKTGHHCSRFVKDHLGLALQKRALTVDGLCEALVSVGDDMLADASIDSQYSGTTVLAVMVTEDQVISAWLGDSRAVMGRWQDKGVDVVELSKDHKPDIPAERRRIKKAGGSVRQLRDENGDRCGPLRVFKPSSTVPGVNFSRSLGDQVIHRYGVSSQVDCIVQNRTRQDRFIVVASDGVFEFLTNEDVVETVSNCATVEEAADKLMATSRDRWLKEEAAADDITVIVIKLN